MGILNVTPDSFSDGGRFFSPVTAYDRGMQMQEDGAALIDIGGMSTRPGAEDVSVQEEMDRVVPVVERITAASDVPVSVDTFRPEVARAALERGASLINDILPFAGDDAMAEVVRTFSAGLVVMHSRGTPQTMAKMTEYVDVAGEVEKTLRDALLFADACGISRACVMIDPGLGFAKTVEQNLTLLRAIDRLTTLAPVLVGASRKRFVGAVCGEKTADQRDAGSIACALWAAAGGASVLRVHDVKGTVQALRMWTALCSKDSK